MIAAVSLRLLYLIFLQMLGPRTELTDRMLIFGEQHLRRVLAVYAAHYHTQRPHPALHLHPPRPGSPVPQPALAGSGADRSSAACSRSTNPRPETDDAPGRDLRVGPG